jgi:serine protease Do
MPLKKHHKILIGSFSSILVIILIVNSIFIYVLYGQLQLSYNNLKGELTELKVDTQTQFNLITAVLNETQGNIKNLNTQITSIDEKFDKLKASVSEDFSGIIEDAVKSVVTIKTDVGEGTGFIITEDGYIVTNYHVIEGAKAAAIYTYDEKIHEVFLIGYDATMDIALLQIEGDYDRLKLGDSDNIEIGEEVIAIGSPYGLQFSVSDGIVSQIHRKGPNGLNAYIQTTAELNPGNSGGPLINKEGKAIGMNNFKISDSEGLGFALESDYIEEVVNEIAEEKLGKALI